VERFSQNATKSGALAPANPLMEDVTVKKLAILLLLLPLAGCYADQKRDLAQCVKQSSAATPLDTISSVDERHDNIGESVVQCMQQAGYQHNLADPNCIDDVDFDVHCYMPKGFWAKAVYTFEAKS
jgi:hypothetical protein